MAFFKHWLERYASHQWQKHYQIQQHLQTIDQLYANVNGFIISKSARLQDDLALTYGEIDLLSFLALLSLTSPQADWQFYELGCGLGKTVLAASLCYQFKKSIGVECLAPLLEVAKRYNTQHNIEFILADLQQLCYHDANLIFINIASFVPEVWQALNTHLEAYPDAYIITCAKPLATSIVIRQTWVKCSWGIVPAYIQYFPKKD